MYKKLRFYLRFSLALATKYYLALVAGLVMGSLAFFLAPHVMRLLPVARPVQRIGLVGRYTLSDLPPTVESKVSVGLTTLDLAGYPRPALASSWQISEDGKSYIFTLNSQYRWHDGSTLKSTDLVYNFKDANVSYPDSNHLQVDLPDPYSPLLTVLARPVIKVVQFPRRYLGVGSYEIKGYRHNGPYLESLTLGSADPGSTLPYLKYIFYPSPSQARIAFKLALLTSVEDLTDSGDLDSWPSLTLHSQARFDRYVAVFFNTQDPIFTGPSGKNLRLALAYAIDKSRWPERRRAFGPIPPFSWAFSSSTKKYDQDLTRAQQFFTKVDAPPQKLSLIVVPAYLEVGEQVKKDWETLGLSVEFQVRPDIPLDFQALIIGQAAPADPDQYQLWHSTQKATNLTRLSHPRIDKLLEDGRKTSEPGKRLLIYQDFQKFLAEEVPAVFLFYPETLTMTKK